MRASPKRTYPNRSAPILTGPHSIRQEDCAVLLQHYSTFATLLEVRRRRRKNSRHQAVIKNLKEGKKAFKGQSDKALSDIKAPYS